MIKLTEKSRKILRAVYRGIGTATVALSISACPWMAPMYGTADMYGMPPDYREDIQIIGQVIDQATKEPINGIEVHMQNINYRTTTKIDGLFQFYVPKQSVPYVLIFTDVDEGKYKQLIIELTQEEAEAIREKPLLIELELKTDG